MAIRDWIAEQIMKAAFYTASPFTASGEPIRWTVSQYFQRFRWKPMPTVRREIVEEYRPALESKKG